MEFLPSFPFLAEVSEGQSVAFEWGNPMPAWLIFTIVVAMGALVVRSYLRESGGSGRLIRGVLGGLRLLLVLAVLALICEPQFVTSSFTLERSTVAIVVDRSRSMNMVDRYSGIEWSDDLVAFLNRAAADAARAAEEEEGGGPVTVAPMTAAGLEDLPRMEIARRAARWLGASLADTHEVAWYAFDRTLLRDALPERLQPEGSETHLGDALGEVVSDLSGRQVSAVVVFTDGQSNGGTYTPEQIAESLAPPDGPPVFTVGIGDPTPPRDIWIADLHAPERALVDDTVVFDFVVGNYGFKDEQKRVQLSIERVDGGRGARVVDDSVVELGGQSERVKKQLRYRFRDAGDYICTVTVPPQTGEIDDGNNTAVHHLKIIDKRIKVLYVEGYPRWEYGTLSRAMIRDRSLETYCLLQSADADFPQETTPGFTRLRAFPPPPQPGEPDPLFDYDVVIIGDVDLDSHLDIRIEEATESARSRLVTFVEAVGGGVCFISGRSHNPAFYETDEHLRKLLPVVVDSWGSAAYAAYQEAYRLKLTREGTVNPILRLKDDIGENLAFIEGETESGTRASPLPGFYWYFPIETVKPTAQVLATHATARTQVGKRRPIFVLQQVGKGKVFWSATDEVWRWRWAIGDKYYYRFWGQVIRALSQGKLLGSSKRVSLYSSRPEYTYGERVEINCEVLGRDYKPVTSSDVPEVEIIVTPLDDPMAEERSVLLPKPSPTGTNKGGLYAGALVPRSTGTFRVTLGNVPDLDLGDGTPPETIFKVREPAVEMENPFMDEERLRAVAARTGDAERAGEFVLPHDLVSLESRMPSRSEKIPDDSAPPIRLWHPDRARLLMALLGLYLLLLSIEWVGRKLNRML